MRFREKIQCLKCMFSHSPFVNVVAKWERGGDSIENIKKDIERFFKQKCFVTVWQEQKTDWGETLIIEEEQITEMPCRLCRNVKTAVKNTVLPSEIVYDAILLFPKEYVILAGSKIEVEQEYGENLVFYCAGEMIDYDTHNEIALKRESIA